MRTLNLIRRFYGGIFMPNFLITLSCVYLHYSFGDKASKIIGTLFWYKIITLGMITYFAISSKKKELYYYQSLGVTKQQLIIGCVTIDFLLWLIIYIIAYKTI